MSSLKFLKLALVSGVCAIAAAASARASNFNIPDGDLKHALDAYMKQSGVTLMYPEDEMQGVATHGVRGDLSTAAALSRILNGTGFIARHDVSGIIGIVRKPLVSPRTELTPLTTMRVAAAAATAGIESVIVTSSKIKGDIQTVPIAITALSQEQLTARQIAGGPDLVKEVPNLTFSKTNFTGYNLQIRGIGIRAPNIPPRSEPSMLTR